MKLAVLASFPFLLGGCILGCSGYSGNGDMVFARGTDQLILCANDGFVATIAGSDIEGRLQFGSDQTTAIEGDDDQTVFTYVSPEDDLFTGLGSGWTEVSESYTQAELDHADVLCTDLTSRSWWSPS